MNDENFQDVLKLDREIFQSNREFLLRKIFTRYKKLCKIIKQDDKITGFIMAIPKEDHLKIGPWVIDDESEFEPELLLKSLDYNRKSSIFDWGCLNLIHLLLKLLKIVIFNFIHI